VLTAYTFFLALIGPLLPHLRAELDLGYAARALHTSAFAAGVIVSGLLGRSLSARPPAVWRPGSLSLRNS
jgi:hypothetical protein